jgi:hypothetical protein
LASIEKFPTEKRARISPFLDFLGGGGSKQSVSHEDSVTLQNWVIQTIARQMRSVKNPSITSRRDTALIAAICAAPAKGTPRRWPQNCLKITENEVLLWAASIWHAWRERLRSDVPKTPYWAHAESAQCLAAISQTSAERGVFDPGRVSHLARDWCDGLPGKWRRLEHAQQMAAHESSRTTKLYDRTKDEITIDEVERIQL